MIAMRGTGRTTRMLEEAYRLADRGFYVWILTATQQHAADLNLRINKDRGVTVPRSLLMRVQAVVASNARGLFNWDDAEPVRGHQNTRVLVDHYAAEQEAARLRARLARVEELARAWDR